MTQKGAKLTFGFWHQMNSPMCGMDLVDISRRSGQHGASHKITFCISLGPRGQHDGCFWTTQSPQSLKVSLWKVIIILWKNSFVMRLWLAAYNGPSQKTPYRRKNIADISYTSRAITHFVPNFVAMATREGPG